MISTFYVKDITESLKSWPTDLTHVWVRCSTALLLTSLEPLWALPPVQRYISPCWLLSRTTEPLDLRPAQQQSTSNREPSSGSSPRTQKRRHSATKENICFKITWHCVLSKDAPEPHRSPFLPVAITLFIFSFTSSKSVDWLLHLITPIGSSVCLVITLLVYSAINTEFKCAFQLLFY